MSFSTLLLHDVSLQAEEIPGIKIFRSSTTINYTNAEMYVNALQGKVCVCLITSYNPNPLSLANLIAFIISLTVLTKSSLSFMRCSTLQSGIDFGKLLAAKRKAEAQLKRKEEDEKNKAKSEAKKQVCNIKVYVILILD